MSLALALMLPIAACDSSEPGSSPAGASSRAVAVKPWGTRLPPPEARRMGSTGPLLPFLVALEELETGRLDEPVSVIQIGDSHTAGDFLSGRMRELLQQRFGAAGRGMLPPGVAGKYYRPDLVSVTETDNWQRLSAERSAAGPFGIAGIIQETAQADERMSLSSTEEAGFDHAFVEVLRRPGAGTVRTQVDGGPVREIATAGDPIAVDWIDLDAPAHSHTLAVTAAGNGPVDILSWGTQRQHRGILYENFGTIGATVDIIGHWDPAVVASELGRRGPALIIVAFGTNESFEREVDPTAYAEDFATRVALLAQAAPQAAIVILGPPDVNRRYRAATGTAAGCRAEPPAEPAADPPARHGAKAKRPRYQMVWAPPPALATVRAAQRQVAEAQGWYFWDWSEAMGGVCAMHRWTAESPPLGAEDHVHQRVAGYRLSADRLFEALMGEYQHYRSRPTS